MAQYRMGDADRERYGGPEWVEFSFEMFSDSDVGALLDFEKTTGMTVGEFTDAVERQSAAGFRAMIWYARKLAGCSDTWADFMPRVLRITARETPEDGTDPPAEGGA